MKPFSLLCCCFLFFLQATFAQAPDIDPAAWSNLKGLWEFEDPANLLQATFGTNLQITGTHTSIPGPSAGDLAVNIGIGSYYKCFHNIPANGGGTQVNEYSLVIDFRAPAISPWYCFYQTNATNTTDGELFISPSGTIGRTTNGPGYTTYTVTPGEWYRLVITADLVNQYMIYLDGIPVKAGGSLALDGEYSLLSSAGNDFFYFFADDNGEDAPIDIAVCAVFQGVLEPEQVSALGGYGHDIDPVLSGILPYLQTPTPTSIFISWHENTTTTTLVNYGTNAAMGTLAGGTYETIGTKYWHTVQLTGLTPNTQYYYQCLSGSSQSDTFQFRTPAATWPQGAHLRFLVFGDNQTDIPKSTAVVKQAKLKIKELFGNDIQNQVQLVINHGDIVGSGVTLDLFEEEYFKPFSYLSANIPCMVSIGNHEMESDYYYQYMKYESLEGASSPYAERYYAFTLANTRFIALNTNGNFQTTTQENWLVGQLAQAEADTAIDFVFVYAHQPGYSEIWPDGNTTWVREHVLARMAEYSKAAFYTCGHTHAYEHSVWESAADSGDFRVLIGGGAGGGLDRWGMYTNQTDYPGTFKSLDHFGFQLIDIDVSARSYKGYCYSLGHPNLPLGCELVDVFQRDLNVSRPQKPVALTPSEGTTGSVVLTASTFSGAKPLMSSHFQLTSTPGDYNSPILDSIRNLEDWYGDSGSPDYNPVNLNAGIDLMSVAVGSGLTLGQSYGWRVRYRDDNLRWSEWSDETVFTYVQGFSISGTVSYDNAGSTPLSQVSVKLYRNDTLVTQTTTNVSGGFQFPLLIPGTYQIRCSCQGAWGGVNATDALLILQHFVGINSLGGIRKTAANVDGNQVVNAVDALAVSRRFTGYINSFLVGDWVFEIPQFNLGGSNIVLNIKGVCAGDVNGSFVP